jgi:hypothetical protein
MTAVYMDMFGVCRRGCCLVDEFIPADFQSCCARWQCCSSKVEYWDVIHRDIIVNHKQNGMAKSRQFRARFWKEIPSQIQQRHLQCPESIHVLQVST